MYVTVKKKDGIRKAISKKVNYNKSWKYNIRRNVNSDLSIVTMPRVVITFFELGVVKNSMPKF